MNITKEITKVENSAVKLTATVAKEDVADSYQKALAKYAKNIQIRGFRKGHVPTKVLEQKFGESLKAEITGDLIDQALNEVFSQEDTKEYRPLPYAQPRLEGDKLPELDFSKDLVFSVMYDVFPKVEVKNFDGIVIKEPQVEIGDTELNNELRALQERNAAVIDKKDDEAVEKDNIVTIDYKELDDAGNIIEGSERSDFVFTVGSGENIYKIDDELIGMKKGDSKSITKTYPEDDKDKDLAGKTKKISVTVKQIKIRTLPELDDDLAQDISEKYKTLDDLKKDIMKNLELARARKISEMKSLSLLEQLVEKNPIELPRSMVAVENESRWRMVAQQFKTTPEQLEKMITASGQTREDMLKQWAGDTERALRGRLVVDALLRERNISVTPEEVEKEYERIAEENAVSVDEIKEHYKDPKAKEYMIDETKENKLFDLLYKEVKVEKGDKMTFAELFKTREGAAE